MNSGPGNTRPPTWAVNPQMGEPRGSQGATSIESENVSRPPEETLTPSVLAHDRMSTARHKAGFETGNQHSHGHALPSKVTTHQLEFTTCRVFIHSMRIKITPTKMKTTMPSVDTCTHTFHTTVGAAVALGTVTCKTSGHVDVARNAFCTRIHTKLRGRVLKRRTPLLVVPAACVARRVQEKSIQIRYIILGPRCHS